MSDTTPEVESQPTIAEATVSATELLQEGDGPTPEADALDERDAKKDESGESDEDEPAEPDPTPEAARAAEVPDAASEENAGPADQSAGEEDPTDHLFRVTHQQHNAGNPNPHSTVTSEATDAVTAVKWLATRVHDIQPLIDALKALL